MQLTPAQAQLGKENFFDAVAFSRRELLIGAAAAVPGIGAAYFGYQKLNGSPVKVGFIGTGDEGSVLLTQRPPEYMDIIAIADIRPTNRLRALNGDGNDDRVGLIRKLGADKATSIKLYDDHRKLLENKEIEAVVIAVPLCQHARIAEDAIAAGKHVLTEKLMAHNITQCKSMIRKAKEAGLHLAVGHQRHYNVLYDNANDLITKGLLGDIKFIRAQWHRNNSFPGRDSWRKKVPKDDLDSFAERAKAKGVSVDEFLKSEFGYPSAQKLIDWRIYNETGAGLMAELGSHQLDAASIFLGKVKPIAVQGYGGKNFYGVKGIGTPEQQADDRDTDDNVYVTFEFPGPHYKEDKNDICTVTYSSISTNRWEPYGETVFGSRGTLVMKQELESMLFKEASPLTGGGGVDQRLYAIAGNDGKPVLQATDSAGPRRQAATADLGKVSRGYTEEMEHFCYCIREKDFRTPAEGGLRCPGEQGMKDAIMALTSNLAMKHKKRIVFKDEWFDPNSDAVPEADQSILA